jgi:hypothetical protein
MTLTELNGKRSSPCTCAQYGNFLQYELTSPFALSASRMLTLRSIKVPTPPLPEHSRRGHLDA